MFQAYGYDMFSANDYIDTTFLSPDIIHPETSITPPAQQIAQVPPTDATKAAQQHEQFSGSRHYACMLLQKKVAEQRFQIFCMWLLLVICVFIIMNMRGKESQLAHLMYLMHMNGQKIQPPSL